MTASNRSSRMDESRQGSSRALPSISAGQRRSLLVARHHLGRTAVNPLAAIRSVAAMHSSDPATPYLGVWARVLDFRLHQLDAALHEHRSLWRLHAMRRTLFVVPAKEAAIFQAGASQDVARKERRKLEGWIAAEVASGEVKGPPARWLERAEARTLDVLADGREWRTQGLSAAVHELSTQISVGTGKWNGRAPVSSRLLFLLAMEGRIVRTRPAGSWRSSQYHWAETQAWFGASGLDDGGASGARDGRASGPDDAGDWQRRDPPLTEKEGAAALLRLYLATHGPATLDDIRWWTGWTKTRSLAAVKAVDAVPVELEGHEHGPRGEGFVLPEDLPEVERAGPPTAPHTVTFLPGLDPTPMGWRERSWYLGPHGENGGPLFDRSGNVGPTVWLDGKVVGGWGQRPDGRVKYRFLETVDKAAKTSAKTRARELTDWLDGVVVTPRFPTPLLRELAKGDSSA
ncbi:MAG: winged helix DNA-binding domain-containing protein [Gemmatimonadota bacterium]